MKLKNGERVTDEGQDPEALAVLINSLALHMDDQLEAFRLGAHVFADVFDAGIRLVPVACA